MTTTPRRSRAVRVLAPIACLAAFTGLTACGDDEGTTEETTATAESVAPGASVTISGAWARTSAMNQANGAAYFVITGGAEDDVLTDVAVSTDIAAMAQIHETVMVEGDEMSHDSMAMSEDTMTEDTMAMSEDTMAMSEDTMAMGDSMTMQEVDEIAVAAGEAVTFEPGGYHVMLMELAAPLETGSTFELELTFENAGTMTVEVEVRED